MQAIVLKFLLSYWKHMVIIAFLSTLAYTGYYRIKQIGYQEATEECVKRNKEYNDKLDVLISKIETNSTLLIQEAEISRNNLKKDLNNILVTIKNKPLYTIEQGKCTPTQDLIDTYNKAIDRVNND